MFTKLPCTDDTGSQSCASPSRGLAETSEWKAREAGIVGNLLTRGCLGGKGILTRATWYMQREERGITETVKHLMEKDSADEDSIRLLLFQCVWEGRGGVDKTNSVGKRSECEFIRHQSSRS